MESFGNPPSHHGGPQGRDRRRSDGDVEDGHRERPEVEEASGSCVGDISYAHERINGSEGNQSGTIVSGANPASATLRVSNLTLDTVRSMDPIMEEDRPRLGQGPSGRGNHDEGPRERTTGPAGVTPSTSANELRSRFPMGAQVQGSEHMRRSASAFDGFPGTGGARLGHQSTPGQNNPYVPMNYRGNLGQNHTATLGSRPHSHFFPQ